MNGLSVPVSGDREEGGRGGGGLKRLGQAKEKKMGKGEQACAGARWAGAVTWFCCRNASGVLT